MTIVRAGVAAFLLSGTPILSYAQPATPPPPPPPLWDVQVGGSFVGTSGNTEVSTLGADFSANHRGPVWRIESTATAVRSVDEEVVRSERYLAGVRMKRRLTGILSVSAGERVERDQPSGMDFRSVLDAGLAYDLVRSPRWTLDALTSLAWQHEEPSALADTDHAVGVLQALSRIPFGTAGDTSQRVTFYPDFNETEAYRSEIEVTAQAALNSRLALKLGYLWRYANTPVPGFEKIDNTTTASVVVRWRADTLAPAP